MQEIQTDGRREPADVAAAHVSLPSGAAFRGAGTSESLTGQHTRLELTVDGRRVARAGAVLSTPAGSAISTLETSLPSLGLELPPLRHFHVDPRDLLAGDAASGYQIQRRERIWYPGPDGLVDADEWTVLDGPLAWSVITSRLDGQVLERLPLFFNARPARIFPANPVQFLGRFDLRDQNDAPWAVPAEAYRLVTLRATSPDGSLVGEHVRITEISAPEDGLPSNSDELDMIDRGDPRFEAANVYHHVDAAQRYLQSLGYRGSRRIVDRSIDVDPRALGGADNSFYVARPLGAGYLLFGTGGTDDAEDPDIIHHELAHLIQDAIAPGTFAGPVASEARAIGEGFGDYWAFSHGWSDSIRSGSDPFCIAEWDARCEGSAGCTYPPGAECLRRTDSSLTMNDFERSGSAGVEHRNGRIWSAALSRIFTSLVTRYGESEGRRIADTLAIEGHFGVPPSPTFATLARRMLYVDALLFGENHRELLCASFSAGRILDSADCGSSFPDAFYPGTPSSEIPDADPAGLRLTRYVSDTRTIERAFVAVEISHPQRGDLELFLIAPDGTPIKLHETSYADVASGMSVIYGLDTEPAESLEVLSGRSARGEWTLLVTDRRSRDVGHVVSWGIAFSFAEPGGKGPAAVAARLPVTGSVAGANSEWFSSDIVLAAGDQGALVELWYSTSSFERRRLEVSLAAHQTLRLADPLRSLGGGTGIASLEIRVAAGDVRTASRIGSTSSGRSVSQAVPTLSDTNVARWGAPLLAVPVTAPGAARVNLGFAEVAGRDATVTIATWTGDHTRVARVVDVRAGGVYSIPLQPSVKLVTLQVSDGSGEVAGWISVIRSDSGDPALALMEQASAQELLVPVISQNERWMSTLSIGNPEPEPVGVTIELRSSSGAPAGVREFSILSGSSIVLEDVIIDIAAASDTVAAAHIRPSGPIVVSSMITGMNANHTVHQFITPARVADLPEPRQLLIPYQVDEDHRTNLIVASRAADTASVTWLIRDAKGAILAHGGLDVPPGGMGIVPLSVIASTARLELVSSAHVESWISVIDNRSGDAETWRALPPLR